MVKFTSENALTNSQKKKPDRPKKRSGLKLRTRAQLGGKKRVPSPVNAVFLVGFMGAGKSSVGRVLGQRLNWVFEDLDDRIQRRELRSIADIFRDSGEEEFRRAEHQALREVLDEVHRGGTRVIALGGGAFVQQNNVALLQDSGATTVFLDAPVNELWKRCCSQASEAGIERPLLRSREQFRELHGARRKNYAKASTRIKTGGRSITQIAAEIVEELGLKKISIRSEQGEVE